jgi:hypothetical protein
LRHARTPPVPGLRISGEATDAVHRDTLQHERVSISRAEGVFDSSEALAQLGHVGVSRSSIVRLARMIFECLHEPPRVRDKSEWHDHRLPPSAMFQHRKDRTKLMA